MEEVEVQLVVLPLLAPSALCMSWESFRHCQLFMNKHEKFRCALFMLGEWNVGRNILGTTILL